MAIDRSPRNSDRSAAAPHAPPPSGRDRCGWPPRFRSDPGPPVLGGPGPTPASASNVSAGMLSASAMACSTRSDGWCRPPLDLAQVGVGHLGQIGHAPQRQVGHLPLQADVLAELPRRVGRRRLPVSSRFLPWVEHQSLRSTPGQGSRPAEAHSVRAVAGPVERPDPQMGGQRDRRDGDSRRGQQDVDEGPPGLLDRAGHRGQRGASRSRRRRCRRSPTTLTRPGHGDAPLLQPCGARRWPAGR